MLQYNSQVGAADRFLQSTDMFIYSLSHLCIFKNLFGDFRQVWSRQNQDQENRFHKSHYYFVIIPFKLLQSFSQSYRT
jgi:hypothetical protein